MYCKPLLFLSKVLPVQMLLPTDYHCIYPGLSLTQEVWLVMTPHPLVLCVTVGDSWHLGIYRRMQEFESSVCVCSHGVMLLSEVIYQIIWWHILLPFVFHCGAMASRHSIWPWFLLSVSSLAPWKSSWAQIWSNVKGEVEGAPKRCDERRKVVERVPGRMFWMGTALGSLTENWFSFQQPKGRGCKLHSKMDLVAENWVYFSM